jgi:uroporphyrinogen-III decarboxylase
MTPRQFDFHRFAEFRAEREEGMRSFLAGRADSNVLMLEKAGSDYTKCRTPQESLACQLDAITRQMDIGGDHVPFLEPWFGVGVYANAFGAEYVWVENESPQTHYVVFDEKQAASLAPADVASAPAMRLVLDAIRYFLTETRGAIPIACTDTQSPFDTATLLWETSNFFTSIYTAPEIVHGLLSRITDVVEQFTRQQLALIGDAAARPGHIMASASGARGLSISDDNIVMVGPDEYEAVAVPYNNRLSRAFGGLAVHSCGNYERQLTALVKTEGLMVIDGAFSAALDPTPNTNLELFRDTLAGTGIILHARAHLDWPEVLKRLYHPDLRLILSVPPPAPQQDTELNRVKLDEVLCQCA